MVGGVGMSSKLHSNQSVTCRQCGLNFDTNVEEYIEFEYCPVHYEENAEDVG